MSKTQGVNLSFVSRLINLFFIFLIIILSTFIALAWLTGGAVFSVGGVKLEVSSLDPWMIGFLLVVFFDSLLKGRATRWLGQKTLQGVAWVCNPSRSRAAAFILIVWIFTCLGMAHGLRHLSFRTHAFDLTFLHQPLFYPFFPRALTCDVCDGGRYFGEHLAFSLYLIAPITRFFREFIFHDHLIFMLQILILAFPLWFGLKRGPLKDHPGLWFFSVLFILCCRGFRNAASWDFREDVLVFAFLLGASLAVYRRRIFYFFIFLVLALFSKENIAFITPFIAIPIMWDSGLMLSQKQRRWISLAVILVSVIWGFISFHWLMPVLSDGTESSNEIVSRFHEFGSTPREVLITLLTSPQAWWKLFSAHLLRWESLKYLVLLLTPFLYFIRFSPFWVFPVVPGVLMNLLSSAETQRSFNFHYELMILPFLIFGLWAGMAEWAKRAENVNHSKNLVIAMLIALAVSGRWPGRQIQLYWPTREQVLDSFFFSRLQSDNQGVAATLPILAQISHLPRLVPLSVPSAGIPEFHQVSRLMLDFRDPRQKRMMDDLQVLGWRQEDVSPSGRYGVVGRLKK